MKSTKSKWSGISLKSWLKRHWQWPTNCYADIYSTRIKNLHFRSPLELQNPHWKWPLLSSFWHWFSLQFLLVPSFWCHLLVLCWSCSSHASSLRGFPWELVLLEAYLHDKISLDCNKKLLLNPEAEGSYHFLKVLVRQLRSLLDWS